MIVIIIATCVPPCNGGNIYPYPTCDGMCGEDFENAPLFTISSSSHCFCLTIFHSESFQSNRMWIPLTFGLGAGIGIGIFLALHHEQIRNKFEEARADYHARKDAIRAENEILKKELVEAKAEYEKNMESREMQEKANANFSEEEAPASEKDSAKTSVRTYDNGVRQRNVVKSPELPSENSDFAHSDFSHSDFENVETASAPSDTDHSTWEELNL